MKEFEIVCPLTREPRLKEIEAKAGGLKWVLKKRSIDARKEPVWRYQYEAYGPDEAYVPYELPEYQDVHGAEPVVVVGAGPAGMFAALKLLTLGLRPIVLERGKNVHERKFDMAKLSRDGIVDPDSNYCYGEGGAGAFSDGKLYTRSSKRGDLRRFRQAARHRREHPQFHRRPRRRIPFQRPRRFDFLAVQGCASGNRGHPWPRKWGGPAAQQWGG